MTNKETSYEDLPDLDVSSLPRASARSPEVFRKARRHGRIVRSLKIALPVLGCLVVAGVTGMMLLARGYSGFPEIEGAEIEDGKLVMSNPQLDGHTKAELPYRLTASRAIQDLKDTNIIALQDFGADVPINDNLTARIDAASGVFDNNSNTLDIDSEINVTTSSGMVAKLRSASVDLAGGSLRTADPVDIEMNGTRIVANSMRVTDRGKVMIFEDRVRLTINPKSREAGPDR